MRDIDQLDIRDVDGGAVIAVKAVSGASRDRIVGILGQSLKVATSDPAEKGKANAAIARTLAKALGVDKRGVELISGRTGPMKKFRVAGLTAAQVNASLASRGCD